VTESRKRFGVSVHNCGTNRSVFRARFAKWPEFHRFCLQSAVNHENAAGAGFPGKSVIVIKSLLLVGWAHIAGSINL
jgi:hypothetical protein